MEVINVALTSRRTCVTDIKEMQMKLPCLLAREANQRNLCRVQGIIGSKLMEMPSNYNLFNSLILHPNYWCDITA